MLQYSQIERMIAFLEQGAIDKAKEIDMRTDEIACLIKAQKIREGKQAVDNECHKKANKFVRAYQAETSRVVLSWMSQTAQYKYKCYEEVGEEILSKLKLVCQRTDKYANLLKLLILQSIYILREPQVKVIVRKRDVLLTELMRGEVSRNYKKRYGTDIDLQVERASFLDDSEIGGVHVMSVDERKICVNTVRERVKRVMERSTPIIFEMLRQAEETNIETSL